MTMSFTVFASLHPLAVVVFVHRCSLIPVCRSVILACRSRFVCLRVTFLAVLLRFPVYLRLPLRQCRGLPTLCLMGLCHVFLWFTVIIVRCIRLGLPGFILWLILPGRPLRLLLMLDLPLLGVGPML